MAVHADDIRAHTGPRAQHRIEEKTLSSLDDYADGHPGNVARRLEQLDREWDTDRLLEIEAAGTGLVGLALGVLLSPRLLLLPATVAGAVLLQTRTGRYPLMPLFRRLGIRTAREISRERYALKALRGDFSKNLADAGVPGAIAESAQTGANGAHTDRLPPTARRVELHTSAKINDAIREKSDARIERLSRSSADAIDRRLEELEDEWDIERVLQANASILSLVGIVLGTRVSRGFLALPATVFAFFAQHALQGWCPPIPVFRRLGVRTRREIERERHALKALRGDFDGIPMTAENTVSDRVRAVLAAVDA